MTRPSNRDTHAGLVQLSVAAIDTRFARPAKLRRSGWVARFKRWLGVTFSPRRKPVPEWHELVYYPEQQEPKE